MRSSRADFCLLFFLFFVVLLLLSSRGSLVGGGLAQMLLDFEERYCRCQAGLAPSVYMDVVALGDVSNLAYDLVRRIRPCSLAHPRCHHSTFDWLHQANFPQKPIVANDIFEEVQVRSIQNCLGAMIVSAAGECLAEAVAPLWCEASHKPPVLPR